MGNARRDKVADEIQRIVSERLLRNHRGDVKGFLTISNVVVNSDFSHATVFYSLFGEDKDFEVTQEALERVGPDLSQEINRGLRLRRTPVLKFIYDASEERRARIESLLG